MPVPALAIGTATIGAGLALYFWPRHPDRFPDVKKAFEESEGAFYSYAGGHKAYTWPRGGPGEDGGIGWDCTGYEKALMLRGNPPRHYKSHRAGDLYREMGSPSNGEWRNYPGQAIFWGYPARNGKPARCTHTGFVWGNRVAISAFGGPGDNGDNTAARVKRHSYDAVGRDVVVLGTAYW